MLEQTDAERVLLWLLVAVPLLTIGYWLFERGLVKSRMLFYLVLPSAFFFANLVMLIGEPLFPAWLKALISALGAILVMIPGLVILRLKNVKMDDLDRRRHK